jgi:hypothetical protein
MQFEAAGVQVVWQSFDASSVTYAQTGPGFVAGLSVIDVLFNAGPDAARRLIAGAWEPRC